AEMQGDELVKLYNEKTGYCNEATPRFEHSTLNKVTGSAKDMSFIVSRDDNDWRFVISGTDLTTEREARKLGILVPSPNLKFEAKAGVWMLTGQCIMTVDHAQ